MTIYFYKVNEPYGCFSNFSWHPIYLDGHQWRTVEHYYQAQKLLGTPDEPLMAVIRQVLTPEEAAAIGRDRDRIIRPDWQVVKQQVMWKALLCKFLTHQDVQSVLLATGEETIVENSPRDYYWGCGHDGTGHNQLGKLLMQLRTELRQRLSLQQIASRG